MLHFYEGIPVKPLTLINVS